MGGVRCVTRAVGRRKSFDGRELNNRPARVVDYGGPETPLGFGFVFGWLPRGAPASAGDLGSGCGIRLQWGSVSHSVNDQGQVFRAGCVVHGH